MQAIAKKKISAAKDVLRERETRNANTKKQNSHVRDRETFLANAKKEIYQPQEHATGTRLEPRDRV